MKFSLRENGLVREGTDFKYDLTFEGKQQYFKRINTGNKSVITFNNKIDGVLMVLFLPGPKRTWETEKYMTSLMGSAFTH